MSAILDFAGIYPGYTVMIMFAAAVAAGAVAGFIQVRVGRRRV